MSFAPRRICLALLAIFLFATPSAAWGNRIVTIDMRDGVTAENLEAYRLAVLGSDEAAHSRVIRLLITGDKGFDAGILTVPRHRKSMNIWVHIYVFKGHEITAPLRINALNIDSQSIKHINLEVSLR